MMKRLSKLLLPMILLPFCLSANTMEKAGQIDPIDFPPLTSGEDYYSFYFRYQYSKTVNYSYFTFSLNVYEEHRAGAKNYQIAKYPFSGGNPKAAAAYNIDIDYDYFARAENLNELTITVRHLPEGKYRVESYKIYLNYADPHIVYVDEEEGYEERGYQGWYETFTDDGDENVPPRYEWRGLAGDFLDPEYMLLPLSQFKIRMRNQRGNYVDMPFSKATLVIYDIENFKVGEAIESYFSPRREVPLSCTFNKLTHYATFRTEEEIIYSPDFREVRLNGRLSSADKTSHAIFLPPIAVGEIRTTKFRLELNGVGAYGNDAIIYDFNITQTHNYIGSSPVSDYYVEEC